MRESGEEQSLGVVLSVLTLLLLLCPSDWHLDPVEVLEEEGELLLAIFDRKLIPLFRAVLNMLLYFFVDCPSLDFDRLLAEGDEELSLKISKNKNIDVLLKVL